MTVPTLLPVLLTVLSFGLGLAVGWLWWGRQFVRARLTREEALSIMRAELDREGRVAGTRVPSVPVRDRDA